MQKKNKKKILFLIQKHLKRIRDKTKSFESFGKQCKVHLTMTKNITFFDRLQRLEDEIYRNRTGEW